MKHSFKDFYNFMSDECGMPVTEDGGVHCCECGDLVYEEYPNHDWVECPICAYNWEEDEEEEIIEEFE